MGEDAIKSFITRVNTEPKEGDLLKKDDDSHKIWEAIEHIIATETDLSKIEAQILELISRYISSIAEQQRAEDGAAIINGAEVKEEILHEIKKFKKQYLQSKLDKNSDNPHSSDNSYSANIKSQANEDFKKAVKNFITYEIYKITNPRRIAGETKKDNYIHNVTLRGKEFASGYTGGKAKDVASYSRKEVKLAEKQSDILKKSGRSIF